MVERGQLAAGVARIRQGMVDLRATGSRLFLPHLSVWLAEGSARRRSQRRRAARHHQSHSWERSPARLEGRSRGRRCRSGSAPHSLHSARERDVHRHIQPAPIRRTGSPKARAVALGLQHLVIDQASMAIAWRRARAVSSESVERRSWLGGGLTVFALSLASHREARGVNVAKLGETAQPETLHDRRVRHAPRGPFGGELRSSATRLRPQTTGRSVELGLYYANGWFTAQISSVPSSSTRARAPPAWQPAARVLPGIF